MKRNIIIVVWVLGGIVFIALAYFAWHTISPLFSCANTTITTTSSPDATKKAVVFIEDCGGAVGGEATDLSIIDSSHTISNSDSGNAMRIVVDNGNEPSPAITTQWQNSKTLLVYYGNSAQILSEVPEVDGVDLNFATTTPEFVQQRASSTAVTSLQEYDARLNALCSNGTVSSSHADFATCAYAAMLNDEMATGSIKMFAEQEQVSVDEQQASSMSAAALASSITTNLQKINQQYSTELALETGAYMEIYLSQNSPSVAMTTLANSIAAKYGTCWAVPEGECKQN